MCLFVVLDTRRTEGFADRFLKRRVRPFLCLAGRFYLYFKLTAGIENFLKKSNVFKARPPISFHTPPFSNACLAQLVNVRVPTMAKTYSKEQRRVLK
jgi:hypothetical protein